MYSSEWKRLNGYKFLDWPNQSAANSIADLAQEMIVIHRIDKRDSVLGSSLGGMVACEISNIIDLDKVVLLGSAKDNSEISDFLQILSPIIDYTPIEFIQRLSGKLSSDLTEMFSVSNAQFIRNMCKAIFTWKGFLDRCRLFRIHGVKDLVIPCPYDVDVKLDGGHLIAITHDTECIKNL